MTEGPAFTRGAPPPPDATAEAAASDVWHSPGFAAMLRVDLPVLGFSDRILYRTFAALASLQIRTIHGLANVAADRDPFILVSNHTIMRESVLMPTLLMALRGGRTIHFLADWNFRPIPGIGLLLRRGRVITVIQKDSRWPFNIFRRFYENPVPAMERARAALDAGASIGIFPEGNLNRSPVTLRPGRNGAARLSLETGVPVVPMGIRFPNADPSRPVGEGESMEIHIGAPLVPERNAAPPLSAVRARHATIMSEIARLSGKAWPKPATAGAPADKSEG